METEDTEVFSPIVEERRAPRRAKTFLGGLIVSRDGSRTIPCTVRDLSDVGAKIRLSNAEVVPEHAYLLVAARETTFEVEISWFKRGEYGLRFLTTYTRDRLKAPQLRFLERLLAERLPRDGAV